MTPRLTVRRLGLAEYAPVWRAMQDFTDQRDDATTDELWLVQHPPVFTQGQAGRAEHLLAPGDIPVIQVDRERGGRARLAYRTNSPRTIGLTFRRSFGN